MRKFSASLLHSLHRGCPRVPRIYTWRLCAAPSPACWCHRVAENSAVCARTRAGDTTAGRGAYYMSVDACGLCLYVSVCAMSLSRDPVQNSFEISTRSRNFSSERPNL